MKKKVLIPNRGVVALDIIDSLKSIGLETILLHSPEDTHTLPVKFADRSYKFYSSKLADSYLDIDTILELGRELKVDFIHPGYGFLAEVPEFARRCQENGIAFIGPDARTLEAVHDKLALRKIAAGHSIPVVRQSDLIKSPLDVAVLPAHFKFPLLLKPVRGSGGQGIRFIPSSRDVQEGVNQMMRRESNRRQGVFFEEFHGEGHHIEIPFFRDVGGNILFLPEIESSIQRRFQKIFQESPSVNLSAAQRTGLYQSAQRLIEAIGYVGFGYVEFILLGGKAFFFEINPTLQINTLMAEIHLLSNAIKKQFAIATGELLHNVKGVKIVEPQHSVMLVSLMAEDPHNNFQPSSGQVGDFFTYSTIRNIFKTSLYTGASVSPLYDPYIGKIVTFSVKRDNCINDMKNFLEHIIIRGIATNIHFLKCFLVSEPLARGATIIDYFHQKWDYAGRRKEESDSLIAAALLSAAFHIENRQKNYAAELQRMKQPGFFKRLFRRL